MNIERLWMVLRSPDDGAGSAAPAPSGGDSGGTTVSGETSVPGDSSGGGEFSGLGGDFDESFDTVEIPAAPAAAAPPSPPTPPAAPAAPAPVSAPAPAAASPTPPAAPVPAAPATAPQAASPAPAQAAPQGQQPAAPAAPASPPADPASLLRELETHKDAVIASLASDPRFGLSQDEAILLETDPGKAVPQLLARTYYQAMNAALAHINNFVPQMVARHIEGTRVQTERENAFYGKFPALDKAKHGQDVLSFARIFRQQNPDMSLEDLFSMTGAAVMAKYGLHAAAVAPSAAPNGGRPPQPAAQTPPFAPAAAGAVVRTTPIEENPFAGLGKDWDE